MEDTRIFVFVKQLAELNKDKDIKFGTGRRLEDADGFDPGWQGRFFTNVEAKDLILPAEFHIDDDGNITNKSGALDDNYVVFSCGDISKAQCKVNDIAEVNKDGYTIEELAMMSKKDKGNGVGSAGGSDSSSSPSDDKGDKSKDSETWADRNIPTFKKGFNALKEKLKKGKLRGKGKGLFQRIKDAGIWHRAPRAKVEDDEELEETAMSQLVAVEHLLPKIADDEYIVGKMKKEGATFQELFKSNPEFCIQKLKEYAMMKEFHDFALKDAAYTDEKFEEIYAGINNLRQNHTARANRMLQEVRYGGVTENQLEFLKQRLEFYKNNPLTKDNMYKNGTPFGPSASNGGGSNGGSNGGGSNGGGSNGGSDNPTHEETQTEKMKRESNAKKKEIDDKLKEDIKKLYDQLSGLEKTFVDDANAENLEPGDMEFTQMLKGNVADKFIILYYYAAVAELKKKAAIAKLAADELIIDEFDKAFIDDYKAEGLDPGTPAPKQTKSTENSKDKKEDKDSENKKGDEEYRMMANERTINLARIQDYLSTIKADDAALKNIEKQQTLIRDFITYFLHEKQNVIVGEKQTPADNPDALTDNGGGMSK